MSKSKRIALVGCGGWGRHILRDLVSLGCEVVVVDPDPAAHARAREHGQDAQDALDGLGAVDGAVVASPTRRHAEQVEAFLARDVPVFCEKPLTADVQEARRLVELGGDRLFVMHKWRYHQGVQALGRLARSGRLGRPVGLETVRVDWGHTQEDIDCLWTLAPHDLSIAIEVLGELPTPRAAVADRAGGKLTGMTALLGDRPWFELRVSSRAPAKQRSVSLYCEGGVARLERADATALTIQRGDGSQAATIESEPFSNDMPLLAELRAFVGFLGGGDPPRSDAAEGLRVVETIAQLRRLAGADA